MIDADPTPSKRESGRGRRCIIVSPHFPPSTLAGVHRARHLAKHLPAHGWKPTIICVDPRHHVERLDPDLAELVPQDAEIVRVGAAPVRYTRPFGVAGDIGLRGYFHLRAALAQQLAQRKTDVVLITGSPYFPMLLAGWIRRRFGVPTILDFQDPWVSSQGARRPRWSKGWLAHRIACVLEPRAVRNAAFITSVSERQNDELTKRNPWLDRSLMAAIPIGGDPDDFGFLGSQPNCDTKKSWSDTEDFLNISYVGTIWPAVYPTLRVILRAILLVRERAPHIAAKLRIWFIGTTASPLDIGSYRVMPIAREFGVADSVLEFPERRPYLEALSFMVQSHGSLILGSDEPHYTASKIYPVLMSGRPFLSIFHRRSSAHEILARAGGGLALAFENRDELGSLVSQVAEGLERLTNETASFGSIDPEAYAPFTAHAVAGKFAEIFERTIHASNRAA